jgi:F-type H+-transporting ATPase subunit gamma
MAASGRDLRRKLKSIKSTQKITSAMQLVAASKMQRAIKRALESRPFSSLAEEIVSSLSPAIDPTSQPLFSRRPIQKILVLLVATNRGLAGSLNTQLFRRFTLWQKEQQSAGRAVQVVAVGVKGRHYLTRYAREQLIADFPAPDRVPDYKDITPIAQILLDEFLATRVDAVYLAYNQFVSTLRQEPEIVQFLPFGVGNTSEAIESRPVAGLLGGGGDADRWSIDILFEPNREEILQTLLPRYLRVRLYQIMLETHASEQAARMIAMKNATDNAGDLLDDLTLTYNSLRQAAITGELLDIAAGAAALEN